MDRRPLNEDLVQKILSGLFNAVLKEKRKALAKAAAADPEIQRILADLKKSKEELRTVLSKYASKRNPEENPFLNI